MRCVDQLQKNLDNASKLDEVVPKDYPLWGVQMFVNDAIEQLDGLFNLRYC